MKQVKLLIYISLNRTCEVIKLEVREYQENIIFFLNRHLAEWNRQYKKPEKALRYLKMTQE